MRRCVGMISGGPGTGKTHVLTAITNTLIADPRNKSLVVAPSNDSGQMPLILDDSDGLEAYSDPKRKFRKRLFPNYIL